MERNADHKRDLLRGLTVFGFVLYVVRGGSGLRYAYYSAYNIVYIYIYTLHGTPSYQYGIDAHARTHARLEAAEELGMQFFIFLYVYAVACIDNII